MSNKASQPRSFKKSNQAAHPEKRSAPELSFKRLTALNQLAQAFNAASVLMDVQSACHIILSQSCLKDIFNFDAGEICLIDPQTQRLIASLRLPDGDLQGEQTYQLGEGYTGWIALNQRSLLIEDTHSRTDIKPKAGFDRFPYRSFMAAPLKVGTTFLGTLEFAAEIVGAFSQADLVTLEIIASQAAMVLENVRLFNLTNQELQRRVDELAGLQIVSSELNITLDLDKILSKVLEEAMRVTQADSGKVYFYSPSTESLIAYKEGQFNPAQAPHNHHGSLPAPTVLAKTEVLKQVLDTGKAVLLSGVQTDQEVVNLTTGSRSRVIVPINYGGEPIGVISLESCQPNFFNNSQLRYLEALANHAAVAIGNAQAYQQQKWERELAGRRADQLARLSEISNTFRTNRPLHTVLEDIAYAIVESVGYDVVLISLVSGAPPMIYHKVGAGIPIVQLEELKQPGQARPLANLQEVMRGEFRLSNSYFIPAERNEIWQDKLNNPDVDKKRAAGPFPSQVDLFGLSSSLEKNRWQTGDLLLTPLLDVKGNIIGLLTVENPVNDQRPDLVSIQTLETFANHAAAAIENAQLFELEQQRRRLADTLRGVAETISSHIEIDELLNVVLQELKKVVDYDTATVELLQDKSLVIIGGQGWEEYSRQIIGLSFSMEGNNPNRRVLETQEPLIVQDVQAKYSGVFAAPPYNRIRSWLGVPLTYGTNILGLMSVNSSQVDFFTQEDVDVVLAFANQVAVALQNARLFNEARQQVRQLGALTEVAQSLNRALELNEVLNLVLEAVFDLVGHSNGSIWLIDKNSETVKIANTFNIPSFLVEEFNRSDTSIHVEPFASVIQSGQALIIEGQNQNKRFTSYSLPFPDDVTYVPLKTEDGVIGILAIEIAIHSKTMLDLVTTLAGLAAVAIDSARLLADTRRRAIEMQQLYDLGVEVSGLLDVKEVVRSVINNALTLLNSQMSLILFWDEQANQFLLEAVVAPKSRNTKMAPIEQLLAATSDQEHIPIWSDLTEQIRETGQPINANFSLQKTDTSTATSGYQNKLDQVGQLAAELGLHGILGVPIQMQNQVTGALFVAMFAPHHFDSQDVQLLSFVANQAAVAVRNAQLVQRLNLLTEGLEQRVFQRTEELAQTLQDLTEERDRVETLYQITRELSSSFDLDRVLNYALSLLNRAIGISLGSILLLDNETGELVYRAALGRDAPLPREGLRTKYRVGYGLAGRVMELREVRLIPDLTVDPDWVPNSGDDNHRSAIVVPLNTGNDVLGALMLFHPEPYYFTDDHLKLVTTAGSQIATAVNNAMLYRLISEQANRLRGMFQEQAAEAAKNEAILKGITDGVLVLDANHNIVLLNPKAAEILNLNAADVQSQPLTWILERSASPVELELTRRLYDHLTKSLSAIEAGERSAEFRIEVGQKSVMITLAPVALSTTEPPSIVAVIRDISKEAEIERLKNEFISTVSHELRTPMTSIKGYADLLLSGNPKIGQLNSTQERFVKIIQSNSNRLTELVNDILEISRIETGRVKLDLITLDIIELINEVAASFEGQMAKKGLTFSLQLPEHLPPIYADKARLTQILVNLIGNAWQYTPEGGSINVYAKAIGGFVQVDVEDSGIGIVEKDLEYIFDRFFRSERTEVQVVDGTGLGLSITKSFVEMLGGQIWVKSKLDLGSTFSFTVPLVPTEAGSQLDGAVESQLLIISDNQEVVDLLKSGLSEAGYQVSVANKAKEALELAQRSGKALRLIFLEALLEEADSFALLEALKQNKASANIPVLFSSFHIDRAKHSLYLQIIDTTTSSFEEAEILEAVRFALNNSENHQPEKPSDAKKFDYILIVEKDRIVAQQLKDILVAGEYQVQCAFNAQQALDMVSGYKPVLALLNMNIIVDEKFFIKQLRQALDLKPVPVIITVDHSSFFSGQDETVKVLSAQNFAQLRQPISIEALISEAILYA